MEPINENASAPPFHVTLLTVSAASVEIIAINGETDATVKAVVIGLVVVAPLLARLPTVTLPPADVLSSPLMVLTDAIARPSTVFTDAMASPFTVFTSCAI